MYKNIGYQTTSRRLRASRLSRQLINDITSDVLGFILDACNYLSSVGLEVFTSPFVYVPLAVCSLGITAFLISKKYRQRFSNKSRSALAKVNKSTRVMYFIQSKEGCTSLVVVKTYTL